MSTMLHDHRLSPSTTDSDLQRQTDNPVSNQWRLPDPEICRTRYLVRSLDLLDCLVENPTGCGHAVRVGSGVFCYHPYRRSFEKTDVLDLLQCSLTA